VEWQTQNGITVWLKSPQSTIPPWVHAIEAYTSKIRKNPLSDMLAVQALSLLAPNVLKVVENGADIECREAMLLGACLAGQAFANAPVGAVHALAYPLGGHFHIPHGLSNALVLPHVMRFNRAECEHLYAELAQIILPKTEQVSDPQVQVTTLITWLADLSIACRLPTTLTQCDIPQSALPLLASEAMLQQRLLVNNPREVSEQDALAIYQEAFA
jgi:alcohol dehydrogenase